MKVNIDGESIANIIWSIFSIVCCICLYLLVAKGCDHKHDREVIIEQLHFNGQYEQRMAVGYNSPIWVKVAADTMKSMPDSLQ